MARSKGQNQPVPQSDNSPSEDLIRDFFQIQKEEINVKKDELKLQTQRDQNQKSYAELALKAQLQDRDHERAHIERKTKLYFVGGIILFLVLLVFCGYALSIGQGQLILKIAEIIGIFSAGFIGGYGFKTARSSQQEQSISEE